MTRKQKQAAKIVIAKDCAIRGKLINERGQTCAIGALALAAGADKNLLKIGFSSANAGTLIFKYFGLEYDSVVAITKINDSLKTVKARRKAVLAYFYSQPTTD